MKIGTHLKKIISNIQFGRMAAVTALSTTTVVMMFGFSKDALLGVMGPNPVLTTLLSIAIGVGVSAIIDKGLAKHFTASLIALMDNEWKRWKFRAKLVTISMFVLACVKLGVSFSLTIGSAEYVSIETTAPPDVTKGLAIAKAKKGDKSQAQAMLKGAKADRDQAYAAAEAHLAAIASTGTARQQELYAAGKLGELRVKGSAWYDVKFAQKIESAMADVAKRKSKADAAYDAAKAAVASEVASIDKDPAYIAAAEAAAASVNRDLFMSKLKKYVLVSVDILAVILFVICCFIEATYISEVSEGDQAAYNELMKSHFSESPGLPDVVMDIFSSIYGVFVATGAWGVAKVKTRGASLMTLAADEVGRSAVNWTESCDKFQSAQRGEGYTTEEAPSQTRGSSREMPTPGRSLPTHGRSLPTRAGGMPTPGKPMPTPRRPELELGEESLIPRGMEPPLPRSSDRGEAAYTLPTPQKPTLSGLGKEGSGVGANNAYTESAPAAHAAQTAESARTARDYEKIASGHKAKAEEYRQDAAKAEAEGNMALATDKLKHAENRMKNWREAMAKADELR